MSELLIKIERLLGRVDGVNDAFAIIEKSKVSGNVRLNLMEDVNKLAQKYNNENKVLVEEFKSQNRGFLGLFNKLRGYDG